MNVALRLSNTNELSKRLCDLSRDNFYDVYKRFEWPEELGHDYLAMSPEITTLSGTELWGTLSDEQKRKLTIVETATLFSNTQTLSEPYITARRSGARDVCYGF